MEPDRCVVVGLTPRTRAATLDLAAELAGRRAAHLRLVEAVPRAAPESTEVRALADHVTQTHPQLHVCLHRVPGDAADLLVEFSRAADLLVVGLRGAGGLADLVVGSTTSAVAARAGCPVLAVPDALPDDRRRSGVVVGVDGRESAERVVAEAFALAADTGERLVAVHAWTDPASLGHGTPLPLVHDRLLVSDEESRLLAEIVGGWSEKYPDVDVELRTVRERPSVALLSAATDARFLVVGRRGHPRLRALVLGSVSQGALHHAPCPVVVVPPDGTAEEER